jgi:hypothetical protein
MREIKASFAMKGWDEKTYWEGEDGRKLTKVDASFSYDGGLKGESAAVWLLAYNPDKSGSAPALERFDGALDGRAGSFILLHASDFDAASVRDSFSVVPGSGTGELAGLRGEATVVMSGSGPYEFTFRYELPH